ncbi:hypothetical protein CLV62_101345 [Dysgonomonas alginatilytica]|uniref:Uncharacterized protein n=1 Tax=Dysgonomonas alginatilytica TaxID=1605892 RepID=A0A2V3PVY7_9BACT|nr:hypothetical protein [Dysgonomonas alginatilytica]PXV69076.1 hypothetical protein CLV62_101345 [Dysgonomonas alginatilytica]
MKYILVLMLGVFCSFLKAQEVTDSSMLIKINDMLNFYDFEEMRSFILKNGDRKTYCPNYTDNPHYEMNSDNLEIYMNPSSGTESKPKDLDYTIMYIVSNAGDTPFNYYLYLTNKRDVYLYDYNKYLSEESVRKSILAQLNSILISMKKEMKLLD